MSNLTPAEKRKDKALVEGDIYIHISFIMFSDILYNIMGPPDYRA